MMRVDIEPRLFRWAIDRAGLKWDDLAPRFKKLPEWEQGRIKPTLNQLEAFAKAVHVPIGYMFLPEPPEERLPIPDFRTFAGQAVMRPSPNLLDTIHACQERQSWYRDFARIAGQPKLEFIGNANVKTPAETVAKLMRETLGFDMDARQSCPNWSEALSMFIRKADAAGVLVMISGVAISNNRRRLDIGEFHGFALSDQIAPLIFINGTDTKAAQMFTLAHELAHLWLGASALSNIGAVPSQEFRREEIWCNAVAAEFLVPLAVLKAKLRENEPLDESLSRLARAFKVSKVVILLRLRDANRLDREKFDAAWAQETARLQESAPGKTAGGDFHRTTLARVSRRFARALVISTLEGQTLYRDAFRMLGVSNTETFNKLGREAGVMG